MLIYHRSRRTRTDWSARYDGCLYHTGAIIRGTIDPLPHAEIEVADPLESGYYQSEFIPCPPSMLLLTLQQRNKPKEAPKAAERAPFFLPTVSGLETRFDLPSAKESADSASKRIAPMSSFLESDFTRRLGNERQDGDCESLPSLHIFCPLLTDDQITHSLNT
jgi:hypothetical protein